MSPNWQVPDFDGNTSAITMICTHGSYDEWDVPTDWTLLAEGYGGDTGWRVYAQTGITATGTPEPLQFNFLPGGNGYMAGWWAFFYEDVGRWNVSEGAMTYTGSQCGFQAPPGSPQAWLQMGMLGHPWTGSGAPTGVAIETYSGTVGAYCYPAAGTYDKAQWAAKMSRAYYDAAVDGYVVFNSNGVDSEQPISVYWTP
jgi:hypothetical protein